ncbi:MAG: lantibiotic dehydratase family protein, partial [Trebonia sp.]
MAARYRPCGVILARSTTNPGDLGVPRHLDLADDATAAREGMAWLEKLWARDDVRDALSLASPALCERVGELLAGGPGTARTRDLRRAVLSVAFYMLRWQQRVTPFGLFAGILPAGTGPTAASIGTRHRVTACPDAEWISALADGLDQVPGLRPGLTVVASSLATVRDGRLVVPCFAEPDRRGQAVLPPAREASVRWTRPVQAAVEIAVTAVRVADLTAMIADRFPAAGPDAISVLVDGLIDGGFLITRLHPPMTANDPLSWMITALRDADPGGTPGIAARLKALELVSGQVAASNRCGDPDEGARLRASAAARMRDLASSAGHPLAVDVRLDGHVTLPGAVLEEAALAADVLLRLTTRPFGSPAWADYHARFRDRYGPGAVVGVRDLVADSGLGYPDGYLGTPRQRPLWRMLTHRDAALLAMIQQAVLAGNAEIRLTDADVTALTYGDQAGIVPPQRAEIGVSLHARSAAELDRGDFELRVVAVPRAPTSMAGRFAGLLTDSERRQLAAPFSDGDAMTVQLSFPPRRARAGNLVRVPPLAPVLALGEYPASEAATVSLDELAVTADATQMYLVHRPTGRRVAPVIPHALELTLLTPPLARFIAEVADARTARLGPLDLGAARALPYVC